MHGSIAGVAQLVERNLAKVEVASSRLVSRSNIQGEGFMLSLFSFCRRMPLPRDANGREMAAAWQRRGGMAEWSCSGLQSRVRRFDSDSRLQ
jgi:hypothetical protein